MHLPEEEQEAAWYNDWIKSDECKRFMHTGLTYDINEFFKKKTFFEGEVSLIEVDELKAVFPYSDRIFVCEQLKVIILLEMMPIYGPRDIDTTLNADYEHSPYYKDKYITDDEYVRENYFWELRRFMKVKTNEEINQENLEKYIARRKKKKLYLDINWETRGMKYADNLRRKKYGIGKIIRDVESEELSEILKTYIISPGEYMYKPFTNIGDMLVKRYNVSLAAAYCDYKESHTMGSTRKELQRRLDTAGYVTDYYGIDKTNTYDYTIKD